MSTWVRVLLTLMGIAAFVVLLIFGSGAGRGVECSGCVEFGGKRECRVGRGVDRASAEESVRTSACAVLASGVTQAFQCSATPLVDVSCQQR